MDSGTTALAVVWLLVGVAAILWGAWPYMNRPAPEAPQPQRAAEAPPAPPTPPAPDRPPLQDNPGPRRRHFTYRRLVRAPAGFDDAIGAGDWAMQHGKLTAAAVWYSDACRRAAGNNASGCYYFHSEVLLRLDSLTGLCLCPPRGWDAAGGADTEERWAALRELARQGVLAGYWPAVERLGSMLYRVERNSDRLAPEGRPAWRVIRACRNLGPEALKYLDRRLVHESLFRLRSALANHPAATRDLWLAMLRGHRTPDLVSTIWEISGAAEDEEVRAALTAAK